MKVVLRSDVKGVGLAGQVLDVADGFARNHLIPQELAIPASSGVVRQADEMHRARQTRDLQSREQATAVGEKLTAEGVQISAQAADSGQLYGSVSNTEIAEAITALVGTPVEKEIVKLDEHIKTVGAHEIKVQLHAEVEITFTVTVVAAE